GGVGEDEQHATKLAAPPGLRPASVGAQTLLPFIERARPILLQEPGQRPVREHPPTGLTGGAVVHFVFRVADALYRRSANRTRLAKPAVDGHAVAKSRHSFRESIPRLGAQALHPRDQGVADG